MNNPKINGQFPVLTSDIPWKNNQWTINGLNFKRKGTAGNYHYQAWENNTLLDNTLTDWDVLKWAKDGKPRGKSRNSWSW